MSVHHREPWAGHAVQASAPLRLPVAAVPVALCALAAIAIQMLYLPLDPDVSWLITVSERLLSGARLYVDIIEVNPPASVWLYLPLVWLAHAIGVRPEAVVAGGFVAAGVVSSLSTMKLASRLDNAPPPSFVAAAAGFVTLVLPMALFAQREHAALLLALPVLTAIALLAEGKPLRPGTSLASGFAAGAVIAIKPHFVLAIAPAAMWAAYRHGSLRPILPAVAAATAMLALYVAAFFLWERAYLPWLPVLLHTYLRFHDSWRAVLIDPLLFPALVLLPAFLLRPPRLPALSVTSLFGALGFAGAAIAQAKAYPNYWLPGAALALFSALTIVGVAASLRQRQSIVVAIAAACLWQMHAWAIQPDPNIAAAITQVAPPHPKILALSRELTTGHPVTRNIGGTWVGSRAGLYVAGLAHDQGLTDPVAVAAYRDDITGFARDIARNSPDVILVDREDKAWLMREPEIAGAMRDYVPSKRVGNIEVWVPGPTR